jgi:hypothetical protein
MTFLWHHLIINTSLTTKMCAKNKQICICMCSTKQTLVLCEWEKMVCHLVVIIFTLRFSVMINILNTLIGITFWCSHVLSFRQMIYFCKDLIYVVKPTPFWRCIFGDFFIIFLQCIYSSTFPIHLWVGHDFSLIDWQWNFIVMSCYDKLI